MATPWHATLESGTAVVLRTVFDNGYPEVEYHRYKGRQLTLDEARMRAAALNVGQAAADRVEMPAGTTRRAADRLRRQAAEQARMAMVTG